MVSIWVRASAAARIASAERPNPVSSAANCLESWTRSSPRRALRLSLMISLASVARILVRACAALAVGAIAW